jgi:hypothetical protein
MLRFNTAFLLKATAIAAFCCLPIVLNKDSGFVWTAFLLPISLATLATTLVEIKGPFEFQFQQLSGSVVEIRTMGGRYDQWLTKGRIFAAGACGSLVVGPPILHQVDPEPILMWLPLVLLFALGAVALVSYSARRKVLTEERQLVIDYLLFGCLCWWRRRWRVRDGDSLAVVATDQSQATGIPDLRFRHTLYVCRPRRRRMIAAMFTGDRFAPDMEAAAQRVAKLVDIPYDGYRES